MGKKKTVNYLNICLNVFLMLIAKQKQRRELVP